MPRFSPNIEKSLKALFKLSHFAQQDTSFAMDLLKPRVPDANKGRGDLWEFNFYLKLVMRSLLAEVDGTAYMMRKAVVDNYEEVGLGIPLKKVAQLAERRYDREMDRITDDPVKPLSTGDSLKLALRYFPQLFGGKEVPVFNQQGWLALKSLIDARNDFAHPKRIEHLIPFGSVAYAEVAGVWFHAVMMNILAECGRSARIPVGRVRLHDPAKVELPKGPFTPHPFDEAFYAQIGGSFALSIRYARAMMDRLRYETGKCFDLLNPALSDANARRVQPERDDRCQFALRNLVRTMSSEIEGSASYLLHFLESAKARGDLWLFKRDLAPLGSGGPEERLLAASNLWSRKFGNRNRLPQDGEGWDAVCHLRDFRNQITHPKMALDLFILPGWTRVILRAARWFTSELSPLWELNTKWCDRLTERHLLPWPQIVGLLR